MENLEPCHYLRVTTGVQEKVLDMYGTWIVGRAKVIFIPAAAASTVHPCITMTLGLKLMHRQYAWRFSLCEPLPFVTFKRFALRSELEQRIQEMQSLRVDASALNSFAGFMACAWLVHGSCVQWRVD